MIRDLNHSAGMRLTAEGQKAAEADLSSREHENETSLLISNRFDFFISYASEDRDLAEDIDKSLSDKGFKVWRDRRQLTLGDSLMDKINEGLAASRFGIVIISRAFLRKNWPKAELNALQARAIEEGQKVILPIRRDLDHKEMSKHFPLLGDKFTISFDQNLQEVVAEIECAAKL